MQLLVNKNTWTSKMLFFVLKGKAPNHLTFEMISHKKAEKIFY